MRWNLPLMSLLQLKRHRSLPKTSCWVHYACSLLTRTFFFINQETEQNIKNLEDLQDEHDFKSKTLQNHGMFRHHQGRNLRTQASILDRKSANDSLVLVLQRSWMEQYRGRIWIVRNSTSKPCLWNSTIWEGWEFLSVWTITTSKTSCYHSK